MSSDLLKKIAAGEAFDLVEGVREIARLLTAVPLEVKRVDLAIHPPALPAAKGEKPLSNSPQVGERTGSGARKVTPRKPSQDG